MGCDLWCSLVLGFEGRDVLGGDGVGVMWCICGCWLVWYCLWDCLMVWCVYFVGGGGVMVDIFYGIDYFDVFWIDWDGYVFIDDGGKLM